MKSRLLYIIISFFSFILIIRFAFLQIINLPIMEQLLNSSSIKRSVIDAQRGHIFDRNHKLLVGNQYYYNIIVIPKQIKKLDTLSFCEFFKISKETFIKKVNKAKKWSPRLPSIFLPYLSKEKYAYIQEKIRHFKGFKVAKKSLRYYPYQNAANVLGYVNEITEYLLKRNNNYALGDIIGTTGIEKQYEDLLKGKKGIAYKQKNKFNIIIGNFKNGIHDIPSTHGKNLTITIDIELQQYLERLMQNKRGAIIAIEPKSGEILSLITMPSYNPNAMVGRKRSKYSALLFNDTLSKPMFNRALMAQYAPGSTFKIIQGLIGLQEGVIDEQTKFKCYGGYQYGKNENYFMTCHCGTYGEIDLKQAITKSCNSYFCNVYKHIIESYNNVGEGLDIWSKHVKSFGFGNYLGYDLPEGKKGLVPNSHLYNKWYLHKRWYTSYTISNAIGQGQLLTTPIQLANMAVAIANKGFYHTPHLLKQIDNHINIPAKFTLRKTTTINSLHFGPIIEGMANIFKTGSSRPHRLQNIEICGKTGTVENFSLVNGKKIQHKDHSVFIAFAPRKNPQIALAIYIENGGFGSEIAAPIASLAVEKYLTGKGNPHREKIVLNKDLTKVYQEKIIQTLKR